MAEELRELGLEEVKESRAGVIGQGSLEAAYRACLWSRLASRVLLRLSTFEIQDTEEIYRNAKTIPWDRHFTPDQSFLVDASLAGSSFRNEKYAALKLKDAVADYFREKYGRRPSVDTDEPDVRLNLHVHKKQASIALDLSGESLSKRGYRVEATAAPLRESSAAALLLKGRWPEIAARGGFFMDPMCGSGTLVVEAALMASDSAPGLLRDSFGFEKWQLHDDQTWRSLLQDAAERRAAGLRRLPPLYASDIDEEAVRICRDNLERAGFAENVHLKTADFKDLTEGDLPSRKEGGLIAANPPYGVRLQDIRAAKQIYNQLGGWLKAHFTGSTAVLLVPDKAIAKNVGLQAEKLNVFYNGNLKIFLALFDLNEENKFIPAGESFRGGKPGSIKGDETSGAAMILNRFRKNRKKLKKYLAREGVSCYRLYDADIPQYSAAVDVYEDRYAVVQEYAPPKTVDPQKAEERLDEIDTAVQEFLSIPGQNVYIKQRKKQKGSRQYSKVQEGGEKYIVNEGGLKFFVNFSDYLDTGIFLDHRITRGMLRDLAAGRRVLNLFAYTCTASVYAAAGGALSTVSVDTNRTYLDWGKKNFELNRFPMEEHRFVRRDSLEFLETELGEYGLIFIDPPTFSNRKGAKDVFDVQRDHRRLIELAAQRLAPGGIILFSNNYRRFELDQGLLSDFDIEEISEQTIPPDYERNAKIHRIWRIEKKEGAQ